MILWNMPVVFSALLIISLLRAGGALRSPVQRTLRVLKMSSSSDPLKESSLGLTRPVKVAYQGEPGAYSEKAARELLGPRITTVPHESFELAFRAVASRGILLPVSYLFLKHIDLAYDELHWMQMRTMRWCLSKILLVDLSTVTTISC